MPCETKPGVKKKPPKEWFDRMYTEVKSGNPEYSDEQVRATVGAIWYKNLSPKQKAAAKSVTDEDASGLAMLQQVTGDLQKAMTGAERPGHKYYKRVPKAGGGYTYYYTKEDWEAKRGRAAPPEKEDRSAIEPKRYWKEDLPFGEESRKELCRRANVSLSWGDVKWEDIPKDIRASIEGVKKEPSAIAEPKAAYATKEKERKQEMLPGMPKTKYEEAGLPEGSSGHFGEGKNEYWVFPSKSNPDKEPYEVEWHKYGGKRILSCDCPTWIYNRRGDRTCSHTDAVKEHLGKDYKKHEEAANMDISKSESLSALIDMDPLRAMNEGKTGLDMLKGLTSELEKAKDGKSSHLNADGTFKGGFDGCVSYFRSSKGLAEPNARRMCAYIGRKAGKIPAGGGAKKSVTPLEVGEAILSVAGAEHETEEAMVKAMDAALEKALTQETQEETGLGAGGPGRRGKPKTEEERKKTHKKKFGTEELPERGSGLDMLRSISAGLEKPLRKSVESGPKGVSFTATGEKIQGGIAAKVTELNQKLSKLLARHPNCDVDDESKDYPLEVSQGSVATGAAIASPDAAVCANKQEHWEIRDIKRKIDRLQRIARNIDPKKTFSLSDWDLQEYGL